MTNKPKLKPLIMKSSPANTSTPNSSRIRETQYTGTISFWRMTGAIVTAWAIVTVAPALAIIGTILIIAHYLR